MRERFPGHFVYLRTFGSIAEPPSSNYHPTICYPQGFIVGIALKSANEPSKIVSQVTMFISIL